MADVRSPPRAYELLGRGITVLVEIGAQTVLLWVVRWDGLGQDLGFHMVCERYQYFQVVLDACPYAGHTLYLLQTCESRRYVGGIGYHRPLYSHARFFLDRRHVSCRGDLT